MSIVHTEADWAGKGNNIEGVLGGGRRSPLRIPQHTFEIKVGMLFSAKRKKRKRKLVPAFIIAFSSSASSRLRNQTTKIRGGRRGRKGFGH